MRRSSRLWVVLAAAVAAVVLVVGLSGCKSDAQKASDAVSDVLASYVVPVPDEDGKMPEDPAWPAADFGDAATMEALAPYGVSADEWHEHCFKNFSYEMGEATVDGDTATVSVTVTNTSLAVAVEAAGSDFDAFSKGSDAQDTYKQGGKAALFSKLVSYVYQHLDANESPATTTVDVTCTKDDEGNWVPQVSGNEALFSALYGGSDVVAGLGAAADAADAGAETGE